MVTEQGIILIFKLNKTMEKGWKHNPCTTVIATLAKMQEQRMKKNK